MCQDTSILHLILFSIIFVFDTIFVLLELTKNTSRMTTMDFVMVTVYKINIQRLYFHIKHIEIKIKNMPPSTNAYKTINQQNMHKVYG